ncbi:MAG: hypothetical protein ACLFWL_03880 [Candidatus Brocadiia bacterium]
MAGLVVLLMVSWGALPALRSIATRSKGVRGQIRGEKVTQIELNEAARDLQTLIKTGLARLFPRPIGSFIFQGDRPQASLDAIWRYLVLVREAKAAGIKVTQQEVRGLLALRSFGDNTQELREKIGKQLEANPEINAALPELFRISKLLSYWLSSVQLSDAELWLKYRYEGEAVKFKFVKISPAPFKERVDVETEELRQFYEEHKDKRRNLSQGVVGYQAPKRIKLEFALASYEKLAKSQTVTDEEVEVYYEEHKSEFEKETEQEESSESDSKTEAGEDPEKTESEGDSGVSTENGGNTEQIEIGGETAEEKGPVYKPLDEVSDEIREKIRDRKAREAAREKEEKVWKDLAKVADRYEDEPLPLEQMAKRHDLDYELVTVDEERTYVSQQELAEVLPGGRSLAGSIFSDNLEVNITARKDTSEGMVIFQVLGKRPPRPKPYEEVTEQVRADLIAQKALDRAKKAGLKLKDKAQQSSLKDAVEEMEKRLVSLLGKPGAAEEEKMDEEGKEKTDESAGQKEAEKGKTVEESADEEKTKSKARYLRVQESDFVQRGSPYVEQIGVVVENVVETAFELERNQIETVVETGAQSACYVIQKLGQQEASQEGFHQRAQMQKMLGKFRRQRRAIDSFLQRLIDESPVPETEKEEE